MRINALAFSFATFISVIGGTHRANIVVYGSTFLDTHKRATMPATVLGDARALRAYQTISFHQASGSHGSCRCRRITPCVASAAGNFARSHALVCKVSAHIWHVSAAVATSKSTSCKDPSGLLYRQPCVRLSVAATVRLQVVLTLHPEFRRAGL